MIKLFFLSGKHHFAFYVADLAAVWRKGHLLWYGAGKMIPFKTGSTSQEREIP